MNLNKKIKVFSYDAGGANLVMAYAYFMYKKGYKVECYPQGPAINIFNKHIPFLVNKSKAILQNNDKIIISTSGIHSDYEIEKLIEAKKKGLEVFCFLDSVLNLEKRFCLNNVFLEESFLPDVIYSQTPEEIIDNRIRKRVEFKEDLYIKYIKEVFYPQLKTKDELILENKGKYFLFLSEYILELYGDKFGFNEYDSLKLFLDSMEEEKNTTKIFIKLHPAENKNKFDDIINNYKNLNIYLKEFDLHEVLYNCKVVFGINSSVFKESLLLGKPTVSIQVKANIKIPKNIKLIDSKNKLKQLLRQINE
ncbi:hypothetical protein [Arcobacter sp. YIC-80]|uniref:capsular polysaccharide export protein, LipB/KpsS family n=1 Tax=unclassified Arcobacter TaxID=2593671 RepID=UPI00384A629D